MKKTVAVSLVLFLFVGMFCFSASAAYYAAGSYVQKININGTLTNNNLKSAVKGKDFDAVITVAPRASITLNMGTTEVNADNVDELFTFKRGTATLTYAGALISYFDVTGTIVGNTATATFSDKDANNVTVFNVITAITNEDTDVSWKVVQDVRSRYILEGSGTYSATVSKWNSSVCSLSFGAELYTADGVYDLGAFSSARVLATVRRHNQTSSVFSSDSMREITGLLPGETVVLSAQMNAADAEYYAFNCWLDGSGHVISVSDTIMITMEGVSITVYASFVPLKPHIVLSDTNIQLTYKQEGQIYSAPAAVYWESSNPRVVQVDAQTGAIRATGAGKATITAHSPDGSTATCAVTVKYTFVQLLIRIFLLGFLWY